ncbi:hypothetical protein QUF56_09615 [Ureibacillus composti]|nr:hypothetical protein [Ureibacillus composti]
MFTTIFVMTLSTFMTMEMFFIFVVLTVAILFKIVAITMTIILEIMVFTATFMLAHRIRSSFHLPLPPLIEIIPIYASFLLTKEANA